MNEQQSPFVRQLRPAARHWQDAPTQSIVPQQSAPARHDAPGSAQQRTGNVTPARHESAPQQSSDDAHEPLTSAHAGAPHSLESQRQVAHDPALGPPADPLAQVPLVWQNPQLASAVHAAHPVAAHAGGDATHCDG